jgi:DNA-binding NtrC family response regulator
MAKNFGERRRGVLIAEADDSIRNALAGALREAGYSVGEISTAWELTDLLEDAAFGGDRRNLAEVFVVGAELMHESGIDLEASFDAVGCADSVLVIADRAHPTGCVAQCAESFPCLQWPCPLSLFVHEVAELTSPPSERHAHAELPHHAPPRERSFRAESRR